MPARGHGTSSQQLRCHSRVGWRRAGELLARRSSSSYRLRCRNFFRSALRRGPGLAPFAAAVVAVAAEPSMAVRS